MRVVVATEARFHRGVDDAVLARTPGEAYPHWCGYLGVFDEVVVLARVGAASPDPAVTATFPVEGDGVRVVALPPYQGPGGYLRTARSLRSVIAKGLDSGGQLAPQVVDTRYLAVMPGMVGAALVTEVRARGLPYALEIIGDAEAVAGGMFGRWARRPARRWLARHAAGARAVGYVTRETLQRRYPPAAGALTAAYAYGRLNAEDFTAARPRAVRPPVPATLVTIGSQDRRYKGHDILLAAVGMLDAWGHRLRVVIVGTGRHHAALVRAARREGLTDVVEFVPALDRAGVRAVLDAADLFVLPSRTEGLARVLIEAMARGVPAIATAVGGTVELLAPQDLVPSEDPERLAIRIAEVLASPDTLAAMSARNRAAAENYRGDRLATRASAFYAAIAGWDPPARGGPATPSGSPSGLPPGLPPVRTPQPTGGRS
ncbi:glycosyltransferase [Frankia gtarii]|uniref:glycosyltransferase n=1 Tax=Frankia gtarii TaxID=2950102 RepID=UPI0021C07507|nr:glycosyltransferase [Frankia gtarii]